MAFSGFTLTVEGDPRKFVVDLSRGAINWRYAEDAAKRAANIEPLASTLHEVMIGEHKELINSQGASIGAKWPDYNEDERKRYVPWKIKKVGDYGPMKWSPIGARLIPSLLGQGPDHVWKVDRSGFEYGTSLPYAKGHHEGTGKAKEWMGGYTVPMRKLIGVSKGGFNELLRTFQRYIISGETKRGGISRAGGIA